MALSFEVVMAAARNAFVTPMGLAHDQWLLLHPLDLGDLRKKLKVEGIGSVHGVKVKASLDVPRGEVQTFRAYR